VSRKPYSKKRGAGRFVQLSEWLQASPAWATLKPTPRALYIELRRRFSGTNNGEIFLSVRDAAKALNVTKNTALAAFKELQRRGFIRMTEGGHLGPSGIGRASKWALEEEATRDGLPAGKAFMRWAEKAEARPKNRDTRPKKRDSPRVLEGESAGTVLKFGTLSA
jgi:DNA-binding transcriptional MocR family regulator